MNLAPLRRMIVEATLASGEGHIPSAFSTLEIIWALYDRVMTENDAFILSKGHAALALYAVLCDRGMLTKAELSQFGIPGSRLGGHPDCLNIPEVKASTGSLGHGLAIACGIAYAWKLQGKAGRVYVLLGDGECQEGSVWEAARLGAQLSLPVTCIIDDNRTHSGGDIAGRFRAFGWGLKARGDGHDLGWLEGALRTPAFPAPVIVLCQTDKGHGCQTFEADPAAWHRRTPAPAELERILEEIEG